jgi:hypothetical protein
MGERNQIKKAVDCTGAAFNLALCEIMSLETTSSKAWLKAVDAVEIEAKKQVSKLLGV